MNVRPPRAAGRVTGDDLPRQLLRLAIARERQRREAGDHGAAEHRLLVSKVDKVRSRGAAEKLRRTVPNLARADDDHAPASCALFEAD